MNKLIISILLCLILSTFAINMNGQDITENELLLFKTQYNQNIDKVPGIAISIFGNEKMTLYVKEYENNPIYISMNNGYVANIGFGEMPEKTMNVYTDENTIKKIGTNEMTFAEALQQGKIRYEGVGILNGIKVGIANIGITIWSWFAG
ncbi:hypothetical protein KO317_03230 [Candidatus Micrarchaeota archaeon]|nr:hypothetical protein [Candidatus Micrarchaeota archaeon]